jgi:hypothetical protein
MDYSNISLIVSYENYFLPIEQIMKFRKAVWLSIGPTRVLFFTVGGRIFYITEYNFCLLLSFTTFFLTIGGRKLFNRYKIGQKTKRFLARKQYKKRLFNRFRRMKDSSISKNILNIIQKTRGGSDSKIVSYENMYYNASNFTISDVQSFSLYYPHNNLAKIILKKCFKPNSVYRVVDQTLTNIIFDIVPYQYHDKLRLVTYDVFIMALVIFVQPFAMPIMEVGVKRLLGNKGYHLLMMSLPSIASIFTGFMGAIGIAVGAPASQIFVKFLGVGLSSTMGFYAADLSRREHLLNCDDYVVAIPRVVAVNKCIDGNTEIQNFHIFKDQVLKQDLYVSTDPRGQLLLETDATGISRNINTLDGTLKECYQVNGQKQLTWIPNKPAKNLATSGRGYIKLDARTKTLSDIIESQTEIHSNATERITRALQAEQLIDTILENNFLE